MSLALSFAVFLRLTKESETKPMSFSAAKIKPFLPLAVLVFLVVFYALNNITWSTLDSVPPYNDSAHHLANYRVILHSLDGSLNAQQLVDYKERFLYAPLYYYFSALAALFFGDTDLIHIPVNLLFYAILLIAVYAAGKKLFGMREGITACLILSLYPYIYGSTRIFVLEGALCSMAALCACFLLYSEELRNTRFTVAAAIVCLVGMLTKQSFLIYVVGPLAFTIGKAVARREAFGKVALLVCIGIVLPMILSFSPGTITLFKNHFNDAALYAPGNPWARAFYFFQLLPDQINILSLLVFIVSLAWYVFMKTKNRAFVLVWWLTPLIILTCAPLKTSKYSLPLLPVIALISSWGLYAILKRPVVRYAILSVVLGFGFFVHYALLWDIRFPVNPLTGKRMSLDLVPYLEYAHKPKNNHLDKAQGDLFKVLREACSSEGIHHVGITGHDLYPNGLITPAKFRFTDNFILVNEWGMKSFILRHQLPFIVRTLKKTPDYYGPEEISKCDFLVTVLPLAEFYPQVSRFYDAVTTLVVPSDGSKIYIYSKNMKSNRSVAFDSQWTKEASKEVLLQKAQETFREGRNDDSMKWLREFLEGKGVTGHLQAVANIGLASNYVEVMVRDVAVSEDCFSKAEHYFNKALKVMDASDPLASAVYSGLGYLYLSKRSYDRALSYLNQGLAYYPQGGCLKEHGDLLTNIGYCYLGMKDPAKAREYFTQAIAVLSDADYETLKGALAGLELCAPDPGARKPEQ
jgi:tetratricopeptide (TPR) repeat protein